MRASLAAGLVLGGLGLAGLSACGADEGPSAVDLTHVHGIAVDPVDPGTVLIATHEGLVAWDGDETARVGGISSDLMGFAVGGDRLYASGHPGEDEAGPGNLGLLSSGDDGASWAEVSLGGTVDFDALDAWDGGVVGFDGASGSVLVSEDEGASWTTVATDAAVADLAADDGRIVATTGNGPQLSTDGGATFTPLPDAPLLVLVDLAPDGTLVGVGVDGVLRTSEDLSTWTEGAAVDGELRALAAGPDGHVWVATSEGLERSSDGGATLETVTTW
ncbi:F510_1955 family glycosylhydrolase [Nocardioides bruguierae]|uniref:Exo-alpha-sialidase n=1 Tax=Nocardioides bruguierae TaxID=2945102 RepID=A0A9X2D4Q7_9ACTN|nr:hypothetical protein [Nocardioides bruguierae]MCM0619260.1 hypothetical protein [Nocardioides bruguierae]